jgi:superfamily I DNA and/or RNA helicase
LLDDLRTIPAEKGVFLNRTYRMHKNVNQFISSMIYEDRLENHPGCNNQKIIYPSESDFAETGIIPTCVNHTCNKQHSAEEVAKVTELVDLFLKCSFQEKNGTQRLITANDILVVAPFNHQVNELKKHIGFNARVGTVDLFQGQEAPIVIVSMTTSQAIDSPRGVDFLLNINRLNVAISRAQALAVVVHAESLLEGSPDKIEDIRRFNLMSCLIERPYKGKFI